MRIQQSTYRSLDENVKRCIVSTHEALQLARLDCPEVREYLDSARVVMSRRLGQIAGQAWPRQQLIVLNEPMFRHYPHNLFQTFVHEVAHLLNFRLNGKFGHGRSWKRLMVSCGVKAQKCHDMDLTY